MTGTEIIRCTCSHPFQDSVYGKSNRVANTMRSGQLKCTVCGTISGSKGIIPSGKVAKAETAAEPVTTSSKSGKKERDNKGKEKERPSSKGKTVKPKAQDKSKKMNKK